MALCSPHEINRPELRAAVARAGTTYYRLAVAIGLSPSALSAYLRGRRPAPRDLAARVEHALKLAPGSLATSPKRMCKGA